MTLKSLLEALQALAATLPDGGESVEILALYDCHGDYRHSLDIQNATLRRVDPFTPNGSVEDQRFPQVLVLSCHMEFEE